MKTGVFPVFTIQGDYMRLYSGKVRIGGSRDHEVIKHNLTAPEMKLLEMLHVSPQGHPVIVDIQHTGDVNRPDAKERARLAQEYSKGELVENRGRKLIDALFGVAGVPLPQEYVAPITVEATVYDNEADNDPEVITPVALPVRSPVKAKAREADALVG